jgi:hypothetical protein
MALQQVVRDEEIKRIQTINSTIAVQLIVPCVPEEAGEFVFVKTS